MPHDSPPENPAGGSPTHPYEALHRGVVWFDRSDRVRWRFTGAQAVDVLNGLLTNDVKALSVGASQYAAALTAKGKIVADVRVFRFEDSLLTDTNAAAAPGWENIIRKFVNPRFAQYVNETAALSCLGVFGMGAESLAQTIVASVSGATAFRVSDLGEQVPGYELFMPAEQRETVIAKLQDAGVVAGTTQTWDVARVEAGRPEWGIDMDDTMLTQEANLDVLGAVSYQKGCYTGQEIVARLHFRGHVNRLLRVLRLKSSQLPALHTPVMDTEGKELGDTRSAVLSPRQGALVMALVRREVSEGAVVTVGGVQGTVAE